MLSRTTSRACTARQYGVEARTGSGEVLNDVVGKVGEEERDTGLGRGMC